MVGGVGDMWGAPAGQGNWINSHLVYTHGFGFVAASANAVGSGGNPAFTESDIPPSGELDVRQPRVYFGQQETSYAIVGGHQQELDYPSSLSPSGQANTTYRGSGGVPVGSALTGCCTRSSSTSSTSCCPAPSTATRRSCTSGTRCRGWPRSPRSSPWTATPTRSWSTARSCGWWTPTRPPTATPTRSG